jgi:predicted small secreted protein
MSKENKIDKVKNPFGNKYSIDGVSITGISFINRFFVVKSCGYKTGIVKITRSYSRQCYMYSFSDQIQGIRLCLKKIK